MLGVTLDVDWRFDKSVKNNWLRDFDSNFSAWVFNEEKCDYESPTPCPRDGKIYFWQGTTNTWVITPEYPTDGKVYKLDIPTATWVLVTQ